MSSLLFFSDEKLNFTALFKKHSFMFGFNVTFKTACMQIFGQINDIEVALFKILYRILKQHRVVGFKPNLSIGSQKRSILVQLVWMRKTPCLVTVFRPGIAEIYKILPI